MSNPTPPQTLVTQTDEIQDFQQFPSLTNNATVNVNICNVEEKIQNTVNYPGGQQYEVQFKNCAKFDGSTGLKYNTETQTLCSQNLQVAGISCLGQASCLRIDGGDPGYVLTKLNNEGSVVWCAAGAAGVASVTAGTGICTSTSLGNVTIGNTGVTCLLAGTGISVNSNTGQIAICGTGVNCITAGSGIGLSANSGCVAICNTGVACITAGAGVSVNTNTGTVAICSNVLCVGSVDTGNTYTNVASNVTKLAFDDDSGFAVTDLGGGTAKIAMNSTFKYWETDGNPGLIACGLDTVNFVAGSNVTITSDNTAVPKTLTISATGGGGGGSPGGCNTQVQFNNSGSFSGGTGLTYNCSTQTVGLCCIEAPINTAINIKVKASDATWYASYGDAPANAREDYSSSAVYDSLGNLYFIGADSDNGIAYIVKYDTNGTLIWQKEFYTTETGYNYSTGDSIVIDSSNNLYCAFSIYLDAGDYYGIVKLDTSGNIIWQKFISGAYYIFDMAVDTLGNLIMSLGGDYDKINLVKIDSTGNILWQNSYTETVSFQNRGKGIITDSANNIYVMADLDEPAGMLLLKLNTSGAVIWSKNIATDFTNTASGMLACDSSDNIYAVGRSTAGSGINFLIKFDTSGALLWQRNVETPAYTYGVAVDSSDNVYMSSNAYDGVPSNTWALVTFKFDSAGNNIWQRNFDGISDEYGWYYNSFDQITTHGNYYAINGYSYTVDPAGNNSEVVIAQLKQDGTGLGTYGNFVYEAVNYNINTTAFTVSASSVTSSTQTFSTITGLFITDDASNSSITTPMTGGVTNYNFGINEFVIGSYSVPRVPGAVGQALVSNGLDQAVWCCIRPTLYPPTSNFIVRDQCQLNCTGGGYQSIGIGYGSLAEETGSNSIALGFNTLRANCGYYNIALGNGSLSSNQYGSCNVGVGLQTLGVNACGCNNVAVGSNSLSNNINGSCNVAIGVQSMACNRDGVFNVALGKCSLGCILTGSQNIAIGACALTGTCSSTSCQNIALGTGALQFLGNGTSNIAIGGGTGGSGGNGNISLGGGAGAQLSCNSACNILIGVYAGLISGWPCVANNIVIGTSAYVNITCNSCDNIAIGTCAGPFGNFECNKFNTIIGAHAARCSTMCCQCHNIILGTCAGWFITGNGNIVVGVSAPYGGGDILGCTLKITTGTPGCVQTRLFADNKGLRVNYDNTQSRQVYSSGVVGIIDGTSFASGTVTVDINLNNIYRVYEPTGSFTLSLQGNIDATANTWVFDFTLMIKQGATPRMVTAVQINGISVVLHWVNNISPAGNANKMDIISIKLVRDTYLGPPDWRAYAELKSFY